MTFFQKNHICVIDNFLSDKECTEFIELIQNKIKAKEQNAFTNNSQFYNHKETNSILANFFYDRFVDRIGDQKEIFPYKITRPNDVVMMAYYDGTKESSKREFGIHTDTGLFYNKTSGEKTQYTMLVYLNTIDKNDGGQTVFYNESFEETQRFSPKAGTAVIFQIDLFHRGSLVTKDKYWIGMEVIGSIK